MLLLLLPPPLPPPPPPNTTPFRAVDGAPLRAVEGAEAKADAFPPRLLLLLLLLLRLALGALVGVVLGALVGDVLGGVGSVLGATASILAVILQGTISGGWSCRWSWNSWYAWWGEISTGGGLGSVMRTLGGHGYFPTVGPSEACGEKLCWIALACSLARSSTCLMAAFSAAFSLDSLTDMDSLPDMDSFPSPPPAAAAFSGASSRALLSWSILHLSFSLALIPLVELLASDDL